MILTSSVLLLAVVNAVESFGYNGNNQAIGIQAQSFQSAHPIVPPHQVMLPFQAPAQVHQQNLRPQFNNYQSQPHPQFQFPVQQHFRAPLQRQQQFSSPNMHQFMPFLARHPNGPQPIQAAPIPVGVVGNQKQLYGQQPLNLPVVRQIQQQPQPQEQHSNVQGKAREQHETSAGNDFLSSLQIIDTQGRLRQLKDFGLGGSSGKPYEPELEGHLKSIFETINRDLENAAFLPLDVTGANRQLGNMFRGGPESARNGKDFKQPQPIEQQQVNVEEPALSIKPPIEQQAQQQHQSPAQLAKALQSSQPARQEFQFLKPQRAIKSEQGQATAAGVKGDSGNRQRANEQQPGDSRRAPELPEVNSGKQHQSKSAKSPFYGQQQEQLPPVVPIQQQQVEQQQQWNDEEPTALKPVEHESMGKGFDRPAISQQWIPIHHERRFEPAPQRFEQQQQQQVPEDGYARGRNENRLTGPLSPAARQMEEQRNTAQVSIDGPSSFGLESPRGQQRIQVNQPQQIQQQVEQQQIFDQPTQQRQNYQSAQRQIEQQQQQTEDQTQEKVTEQQLNEEEPAKPTVGQQLAPIVQQTSEQPLNKGVPEEQRQIEQVKQQESEPELSTKQQVEEVAQFQEQQQQQKSDFGGLKLTQPPRRQEQVKTRRTKLRNRFNSLKSQQEPIAEQVQPQQQVKIVSKSRDDSLVQQQQQQLEQVKEGDEQFSSTTQVPVVVAAAVSTESQANTFNGDSVQDKQQPIEQVKDVLAEQVSQKKNDDTTTTTSVQQFLVDNNSSSKVPPQPPRRQESKGKRTKIKTRVSTAKPKQESLEQVQQPIEQPQQVQTTDNVRSDLPSQAQVVQQVADDEPVSVKSDARESAQQTTTQAQIRDDDQVTTQLPSGQRLNNFEENSQQQQQEQQQQEVSQQLQEVTQQRQQDEQQIQQQQQLQPEEQQPRHQEEQQQQRQPEDQPQQQRQEDEQQQQKQQRNTEDDRVTQQLQQTKPEVRQAQRSRLFGGQRREQAQRKYVQNMQNINIDPNSYNPLQFEPERISSLTRSTQSASQAANVNFSEESY